MDHTQWGWLSSPWLRCGSWLLPHTEPWRDRLDFLAPVLGAAMHHDPTPSQCTHKLLPSPEAALVFPGVPWRGSLSLRGLLGWQGLTLLPVVLPPTHLLSSLHPSCPLSFLPLIVPPLSCRLFFLPSAGCTLSCQLNCALSFPPAVLPPFCLQSSLPLLGCPPPTGLSPKPPAVGCSALQRRPGNRALGRHLGPCLPADGSALVWCSLGLLQPHPESGLAAGQGSVCSQCLWPLLYPGCAPELPGCHTGVSQSQTWTSSGCCKGEGDPESQLHCLSGMDRWADGKMDKPTCSPQCPGARQYVGVCPSASVWDSRLLGSPGPHTPEEPQSRGWRLFSPPASPLLQFLRLHRMRRY